MLLWGNRFGIYLLHMCENTPWSQCKCRQSNNSRGFCRFVQRHNAVLSPMSTSLGEGALPGWVSEQVPWTKLQQIISWRSGFRFRNEMARMHILCIAFASGHLGYIIGLLESEAQDERSCRWVSVWAGNHQESSGWFVQVSPRWHTNIFQNLRTQSILVGPYFFFGTQLQHRWGTVSLTFGGFEFGPSAVAVWWSSSKCLLLSWLWENSDWYGDMKHQETGSMMGLIWIYMDHNCRRRRRHHHHHHDYHHDDDYYVSLSSLLLLVSLLLHIITYYCNCKSSFIGRPEGLCFLAESSVARLQPRCQFLSVGVPGNAPVCTATLTTLGGFLSHGGTPIAGWFIGEDPIYKWMVWGYGSSIFGKL